MAVVVLMELMVYRAVLVGEVVVAVGFRPDQSVKALLVKAIRVEFLEIIMAQAAAAQEQ